MNIFRIPRHHKTQDLILRNFAPVYIYDKFPLQNIDIFHREENKEDFYLIKFNHKNSNLNEMYLEEKIYPFLRNLKLFKHNTWLGSYEFIGEDLRYLYNMQKDIYVVENDQHEVIGIMYGDLGFDKLGYILKAIFIREDYHDKRITEHLIEHISDQYQYFILIENLDEFYINENLLDTIGFVNIGCNKNLNIWYKSEKDYREFEIFPRFRHLTRPVVQHYTWFNHFNRSVLRRSFFHDLY